MYLGLFVQLHGLPKDTDPESVVQLMREYLHEEFHPEYSSNIEVTVEERT